jgi:hypothetical protein
VLVVVESRMATWADVFVECRRQRDGSVKSLNPILAACEACGGLPEFVTGVIHPFDETRSPHGERVVG